MEGATGSGFEPLTSNNQVDAAGAAAVVAGPAVVIVSVPPRACQITCVAVDVTDGPKAEVRAWLEKLGALTAPMTAGRVFIEGVDQGRKPRQYHVRMELTLPDGVVVVGPDHPSNGAHEDVYVAIRNAFRAARRQLGAHVQTRPAAAVVVGLRDPGDGGLPGVGVA